jgi:hypothetical protein
MKLPFFKSRAEDEAYKAGMDCAVNGENTENCHFSLFGTPELRRAWEMGKERVEKVGV